MRKVYIGDVDGDSEACKSRIQRKSEERIFFETVSTLKLKDYELSKNATDDTLVFYVPFLNKFQGTVLYVESNFVPTLDVDLFFSHKVHNNLGPVLYFSTHNVWLIDCSHESLKQLNTFQLDKTQISNLKNSIDITVVESV
jgi:hypothetical protein